MIHVTIQSSRGPIELRMASVHCPICNEQVSSPDPGEGGWSPSRIGGDSRNGYEPIHRQCVAHDERNEQ